MAKAQLAASVLSADFSRLGEECEAMLTAGADWIHFDVMDNHYVPNLTVGPLVCQALRNYGIEAPIDVHLMVEPVDALVPSFAEAGASLITFHPEATRHADRTAKLIRAQGCEVGVALNPATPVETLSYLLENIDLVLLMAVNPGFAGQQFIDSTLSKCREVSALIAQTGKSIRLQVDGGVKADNIAELAACGVDTFVMGSALFGAEDYSQAVTDVRAVIDK